MRLTKQSGRKNLPPEELRIHTVSVRLNDAELGILDGARAGNFQRGEALRMLALHRKLPPRICIPEINRSIAADLRRALGNLSTLATAMRSGEYVPIDEVRDRLHHVRSQLLEVEHGKNPQS